MKRSKREGFTLIELVVVISIILVFAGFLIPKFTGYLDKAKETKAINTAKQLQAAAMTSYGENDGKFTNSGITELASVLTSADVTEVASAPDGKSATIKYISDEVNYELIISDNSGAFEVKKNSDGSAKVIYPR